MASHKQKAVYTHYRSCRKMCNGSVQHCEIASWWFSNMLRYKFHINLLKFTVDAINVFVYDYISVGINLQLKSRKNANEREWGGRKREREGDIYGCIILYLYTHTIHECKEMSITTINTNYKCHIENVQVQFNENEIKLMLDLYSIEAISCEFPLV